MSPSIIGGILLILGAYYMFQGNIFRASIFYLTADLIWIVLSYMSGDVLGTSLIVVGALLGLGAFLKMNFGIMKKTLHWD